MNLLLARPGRTLALALLVTLAALGPASRLAIETDPVELMPTGSPATADYRLFLERFGGFEKVFVLVLSEGRAGREGGPEATRAELMGAADRLSGLLAVSPEVASARAGLEEADLEFLRRYVAPRAPLLLGDDWRATVAPRLAPQAIHRRVARIRRSLSSPVGSPDALWWDADPLGFSEELRALRSRPSGLPVDLATGAFLSSDGRAALVLVTPRRTEVDPEGGRALAAELQRAYAEVRRGSAARLRFLAVGGPLYAAEDEQLIRSDVRSTLIGSAIGCVLLLIAAFGSATLPVVAFAAVAAGLVWTAAGLELSLGAITAAGLGFSAVLLGLGIDYGIHGAARYRQGLLSGASPGVAMSTAFRSSGAGILASALTTAGAFAVLSLAHFRPLRELGLMVALGILCVLITTAAIGAPLACLLGSRATGGEGGRIWRWMGVAVEAMTGGAARRAAPVLAALGLLSALSLAGLFRLTVDSDLRAFRSTRHSAFEAESALAERFGAGLETLTVVLSGADLRQAMAGAERVRHWIADVAGPEVSVTSPADWLVGDARSRLAELDELPFGEAAEQLEGELRQAGLSPEYFGPGLSALRALGEGRDPGAPPVGAWPPWLGELVRVDPDGVWAAVRVRGPEGVWPDGPPADLVAGVERLGGRVASASRVGAELRRLAGADLLELGGIAFAVVALVVLVSFRGQLGASVLALVPVLLGGLWSLGLWGALGRPLDLATLAVLPIILGIGLDDGLHALHALRRDPTRGIVAALGEAGRPMILTTATTALAFGSLATTSVPGLRNAGLLVSLGVLGCLVATLLALPALAAVTGERRSS
jgi:uncharacterized protein